ncbi:MAG: N-acetyltransferase GCN5 [Oscillospiraceae bacterium]|jgi:L-amino acid N-acyltransferase YncA
MYQIRFASEKDSSSILKIYQPYILETAITFEEEVPTPEEYRERVASISRQYPWLVCERNGVVIGYAYAHRQMERASYRWNAELSIYLERSNMRRGIGKALYGALLEILQHQRIQNVYAGITVPNPNSERLHESMGFHVLGTYHRTGYKCGKWHDVVWYEKEIGNHESNPVSFLPIHALNPKLLHDILDRYNQRLNKSLKINN